MAPTARATPAPTLTLPPGALAKFPPLVTKGQTAALNFLLGVFPVPPFLLPIYHAAAAEYGVPWQVLAAINEIETDYGRNLSTSTAGAIGWMQFLPSTWARFGVDADGDGLANPYSPVDAIFSAARYLRAAGAGRNLPRAIFAYNHAGWYVNSVELRAQLLRFLPARLVDVLTGLMQGRFPIGGHLGRYARQAPAPTRLAGQPAVVLTAPPGAPVIASADGRVVALGTDARRGRYLTLEDSYGNRFTYAELGQVQPLYPLLKPRIVSAIRTERALAVGLLKGARIPAATKLLSTAASSHRAAAVRTPPTTRTVPGGFVPMVKERLFADPSRPASYAAGGVSQLEAELGVYAGLHAPGRGGRLDYYSEIVHLGAGDFALERLSRGAVVLAGTVLGHVGRPATGPGHIAFQIRPAGAGAAVDPTPIVAGWRVLGRLTSGHGSVVGAAQAGAYGSANPWVGQLLMASGGDLERSVLADPRVALDACARRAIGAGVVDRRVLAVIEYLSYAGLDPGVSGLPCPQQWRPGSPLDTRFSISQIAGAPVSGHGQPGGAVDLAVRALLTLQGALRPSRIVSQLRYPWDPATVASSGVRTRIVVQLGQVYDLAALSSLPPTLDTAQWKNLVRRLVRLDATGANSP